MQMRAADDREYWLAVLAAGGTTAVPRWATEPEPGIGDHVAPIPAEVLAALDARPYGPDVPFVSLLLTAHAAVLAALSGERDVVTGYLPAGADRPLPCPLSAEPGTWRDGTRNSRAPSGVDGISIGVSTSVKPWRSMARRMALLTFERISRLRCMRSRRRSM